MRVRIALFISIVLGATSTTANAQDAMFVDSSGNVGVGTNTPSASLDLLRSDGSANILVQDSGTTSPLKMFELRNNGFPRFTLRDDSAGEAWDFRLANGKFTVTRVGTGGPEFEVFNNGDAELRGTLSEASSRDVKDHIVKINPEVVLTKLNELTINEWNYANDEADRHMGPMAENFYATFGLGPDNKHIAPKDLAGVALAAAKALKAQNESLQAKSKQLRQDNKSKERRIRSLERRMEGLEALLRTSLE